MSAITDIIGNAKSAVTIGAKGQAQSALGQLSQGDITGAIQTLAQAPQSILSSYGASGGVNPGDALRGLNAREDAVQNWCWYCMMPDLVSPGATLGQLAAYVTPANLGSSGSLSRTISLPWYYIPIANAPFRSFEADSVQRNAHPTYFPGSYSVSDLNLSFFMDSSSKAHMYLKAWQALVMSDSDPTAFSNQGLFGLPSQYKKNITLFILSVTKKQLLQLKYINCWPKNLDALELTSDSSTGLSQPVSFAVEDVKVTVNNDKGLVANLLSTASGFATTALTGAVQGQLNKFASGG